VIALALVGLVLSAWVALSLLAIGLYRLGCWIADSRATSR
jgi:hypothetical protein